MEALEIVGQTIAMCRTGDPFASQFALWRLWNVRSAFSRAIKTWADEAVMISCSDLRLPWDVLTGYVRLLTAARSRLAQYRPGPRRDAIAAHIAEATQDCVAARARITERALECVRNERWGLMLPPAPPTQPGVDPTIEAANTAASLLDIPLECGM